MYAKLLKKVRSRFKLVWSTTDIPYNDCTDVLEVLDSKKQKLSKHRAALHSDGVTVFTPVQMFVLNLAYERGVMSGLNYERRIISRNANRKYYKAVGLLK